MKKPKIIAFAGSARKDSYNKKLIRIAAEGAAEAGAGVDILDLADYPMPMFNEDLESESGMDIHARAFKEKLMAADGFIISSPEYNSAISPLLKNAIDWASRKEDGEQALEAYQGKTAALIAASPGGLGGLRGLNSVRSILTNIGVIVIPQQFALPSAYSAFDESGALTDPETTETVKRIGQTLVEFTSNLM